jgi:eukaryotic-like serine/threonine-protein kinase
MPHHVPLRAGDPRRVGRYRLTGQLAGLPSDDPLFIGAAPDGAPVAITLLGGDWARRGAARDRFAAEAAVAKRVPPFCAARVLDAGLEGDVAYLVSEYIPGQSLLELVAEDGVREGQELEALAIGMATGLASVHQAGLVHGSFGPQYLILPAEGPPRVVEYGITPPYGSATPSADMFAWAQTVVFAATGHPPSGHGDLDFLPERTREPVQQCLELDSLERPAARAVLQFLLGDGYPAAGLLAEGSRRASRSAVQARPLSAAATVAADRGQPGGAAVGRAALPGPARSAVPPPRGPQPTRPGRPSAGREVPAAFHNSGGHIEPGQQRAMQRRAASSRGQSGRTRRPVIWAIAGGAVVVVALVALLIVHLLQGGSPPSHRKLAATARTPAATASPTASASLGPTTPAAFGGTWSGTLTQDTDTFTGTVTLTAGQASGTLAYNFTDLTCSGDLALTSATSTTLTMNLGIVVGQSQCSNGTVTLTLTPSGSVSFTFQSKTPGTEPATGMLTRQ